MRSHPLSLRTGLLAGAGPQHRKVSPACLPNLLAILGRADVWATASPSLSLKIQLSLRSGVPPSPSAPSGCERPPRGLIPRARSSRGRQTGSERVSIYREQNTGLRMFHGAMCKLQ